MFYNLLAPPNLSFSIVEFVLNMAGGKLTTDWDRTSLFLETWSVPLVRRWLSMPQL